MFIIIVIIIITSEKLEHANVSLNIILKSQGTLGKYLFMFTVLINLII